MESRENRMGIAAEVVDGTEEVEEEEEEEEEVVDTVGEVVEAGVGEEEGVAEVAVEDGNHSCYSICMCPAFGAYWHVPSA